MKNLFKNLMLVAVAAMAFTACTESNNEVDASVEKVVLNFVAEIDNDGDETRSGFVGSTTDENGTKYQSAWDGTEKLAIFDMSTYNYLTETTINAEGQFSVEFEGNNMPDYIYVCSPASAWSDPYTCTIPAEQTPLANSVDPAAHILNGYVSTTSSELSMQHQVAYGKMTLKDVDFEIARVELNLKGVKYGWDSKDITYTLHNNGSVVDNVFWFTTEPSFVISEFTVTAFDAEGNNAVTKTVDVAAAGKTLSFGYGQVSKFSVSGLEEAEEDTYPVFTIAEWTNAPTHDKKIQFWGDNGIYMILNFSFCNYNNFFDLGEYTIVPGGSGPWQIYGAYNTSWCIYHDAEGNEYGMSGGTVNIDLVGGEYVIEFIDLQLTDAFYNTVGTLPYAKFTGEVENMIAPDNRTPLATPEVTYELNGKTLIVSWNDVDGAVGYYVHDYYYDIDTTTTKTTLTVELSEYKWYYIYVSAIAADDDANFKDSYEAEISFELKDPRTVLPVPINVRATIDGRYATIEWDDVEGADYYTLSYYLNGNQEVDVEGTSHTIDVGFDVSNLWVYVFAKANDDNENYKSSESWDAFVVVNTGSDPSIVPIAFTTCVLNEYLPGQWRVSYNFSDGANNSMTLWLTTDHGANDASLGSTQTYDQFYSSPGSVGNYYRFCPENVVVNGESKTVTGGNVKIDNLATSWDVKMTLTFDDGSKQIFTYSGGVGADTGGDDEGGDDSGEFTPDYTINTFSFYRLSTNYYTYQWSVQTSNGLNFSIYTPYNQGNELHEGTYTYYSGSGNTNGDFTFSTRTFSPAPSSGTMVVSKDGDTYTINLTVVVGGTTQKYQYVGTL